MFRPLALIVEDEPDHILFFRKVLETADYEVASISDGHQAIDYLQNNVPYLILLDFHLPSMNGVDILAHIQGDSRLDKTIVIVITADFRFNDYPHERANFVLSKPARYKQIQGLVVQARRNGEPED